MADSIGIELDQPRGEALRIEWPVAALTAKRGRSAGEPPWRIDGEIDWEGVQAVRIVSIALPDGRGLALGALRPAGAAGHGEEIVAAALVANGAAEEVAEPLLSVELDRDRMPRRIGLELHTETEAIPLRVAADVTDASVEHRDGIERVRAALEVRLEGKRSVGAYDVLSASRRAAR